MASLAINVLHAIHVVVVIILLSGPIRIFEWCPQWFKTIQTIVLLSTIIGQVMFLGCPIVVLQGCIARKYLGDDRGLFSVTGTLIERITGRNINPTIITVSILLVMAIVTYVVSTKKINI